VIQLQLESLSEQHYAQERAFLDLMHALEPWLLNWTRPSVTLRPSPHRPEQALNTLLLALALFAIPFIWEVLRPMPLPILLNRRTRELYFEQDDEL